MNPPLIACVGSLRVVRDDLLPGGTKRRALAAYLPQLGAAEVVYASPAYGYAQVALAHACRDLGMRATIFTAKRRDAHPLTRQAIGAGAKVIMVPTGYLSNVRAKARAYCEVTGATALPFGLDDPLFLAALADVARATGMEPNEVWTVAGSGVLTRALQLAWPAASFHAIQIGAAPNVGRARLYKAPESFEDAAQQPPPFPSCTNYDAKAWRFVSRLASPGALFWNVAA